MAVANDLNQCYRKKVFRSAQKAHLVAEKYNKISPPPDGKIFHEYSCPVCFKWHVGRTSPERKH